MAIEPKLVLEYIGIDVDAIEDEAAMREAFDGVYVKRENAHTDKDIASKVFGKANGTIRTRLAKAGKELGIEHDWAGTDPTEGIDALAAALKSNVDKLTADLAAAKKGGASNKDVEELSEQLTKLKGENEAFKKDALDWQSKHDTLSQSVTAEKAAARENGAWSDGLKGLQFAEGVSDYAKKGFAAEMRSKYRLEFADDGAVKVLDKNGAIMMDKKKAQTFASLADLVAADAAEAKLTGVAPQGGTKFRASVSKSGMATEQKEKEAGERPTPGRRVMPRN